MQFENMDDLIAAIEAWGEDKGILPNPDSYAQYAKTREECDELYWGVIRKDADEVRDAVGDVVVTLIMQCGAWDFTFQEAVESAYNVIKQRKGRMVNGQFIKEGE